MASAKISQDTASEPDWDKSYPTHSSVSVSGSEIFCRLKQTIPRQASLPSPLGQRGKLYQSIAFVNQMFLLEGLFQKTRKQYPLQCRRVVIVSSLRCLVQLEPYTTYCFHSSLTGCSQFRSCGVCITMQIQHLACLQRDH